jgi:hypothetical protein
VGRHGNGDAEKRRSLFASGSRRIAAEKHGPERQGDQNDDKSLRDFFHITPPENIVFPSRENENCQAINRRK